MEKNFNLINFLFIFLKFVIVFEKDENFVPKKFFEYTHI